jgi:hypothetical protein
MMDLSKSRMTFGWATHLCENRGWFLAKSHIEPKFTFLYDDNEQALNDCDLLVG